MISKIIYFLKNVFFVKSLKQKLYHNQFLYFLPYL